MTDCEEVVDGVAVAVEETEQVTLPDSVDDVEGDKDAVELPD